MTTQQLIDQIQAKKSFLCVGLDVDLNKIPQHLLETEDPIFEFNKAIIDATHDLAVSYKPNTAFYEAYGIKGWLSLEKTIRYINENYPAILTIADAPWPGFTPDLISIALVTATQARGSVLIHQKLL